MFWLAKVSVSIALSHKAIRVCIISFVQKQLERRSSCCGGDTASRQINIFPRWMTTWSGLWAPGAFCCTSKWRDVFMNLISRCSAMKKKKNKKTGRETQGPRSLLRYDGLQKLKLGGFLRHRRQRVWNCFSFSVFFSLNIHASNACTAKKKKKVSDLATLQRE